MTDPSIRMARISELLFEELEGIIPFEMDDPRLIGCRVTRIRLAPDLNTCRVYVLNDGPPEERPDVLHALEHAAPFIRSQAAASLGLKHTPKFLFFYDDAEEKAERVDAIIRGLEHRPDTTAAGPTPEDASDE
ncbi:MAG TPA: 30S ribosome-binding factor RbfA [Acidobacteriota bacterium]|nr:30S ribosome-binding factor RbfA [Acidobacteriota bacterium]HOS99949.1 30S ribosome-binding factor RbfA [Acidobacteriota bacterium]HQF85685.1 30S ribosome-binding factor RbfA [Acidobacteriota bacterium]HQG91071.1 30S ribosome-binding factor RbfA [Acidobacteriota bacterium]HQK86865.1 30S ribosome-binding factor RbfA [Acidobacteriota bacterium]